MEYSKPKITIDYQEYLDLQQDIRNLEAQLTETGISDYQTAIRLIIWTLAENAMKHSSNSLQGLESYLAKEGLVMSHTGDNIRESVYTVKRIKDDKQ